MDNKSIRKGIKKVVSGIAEIIIASYQHIDKGVHAMPWIAVFVTAMVIGIPSVACIMQSRAERNTAQSDLYNIQKKYDSLIICLDKK